MYAGCYVENYLCPIFAAESSWEFSLCVMVLVRNSHLLAKYGHTFKAHVVLCDF